MKTRDIMKEIIEDKVVLYKKMLQEAASEQEKHERSLVLQALSEVLNDVDKILDSLPYT
jgi:hypothetical protein